MVGVPKSKRCAFCKQRKTKCDENWPTCGTCARAGKVCSGEGKKFKFVVNGSHSQAPTGTGRYSLTGGRTNSVTCLKRRNPSIVIFDPNPVFKDGCSFGCHAFSNVPTSLPWNAPDQINANLITCLNAAPDTGDDLRILGAFLPLIPQHIDRGNTALGYAVELLLGAWRNSRRGLPVNTWLDLRTYNRAIRSVTDALTDSSTEHLTNTLTALCLLQKTEILYDFTRGSNQENHAAGLIYVVSKSGLTLPMNEMILHVTFESVFHMLQEDIRQGRTSACHTPEWMMRLRQSIDASRIRPVLKHLYHLWVEMTAWPALTQLVRVIRQDPSDTMAAAELRTRANLLANLLQERDETIIASLTKDGYITKVKNTTRPDLFPKRYEFVDFPTSKLFAYHALFTIIACRFLEEADKVLQQNDPSVEEQAKIFSKRILMAYPWFRMLTPLAVDFTACLVFSYESGNDKEREFCMECLREMDSCRHPPPIGQWVEATIMANAKAYSGRLPFIKTQDWNVEYAGAGCRS